MESGMTRSVRQYQVERIYDLLKRRGEVPLALVQKMAGNDWTAFALDIEREFHVTLGMRHVPGTGAAFYLRER
jgi:hypothetical protein